MIPDSLDLAFYISFTLQALPKMVKFTELNDTKF